jgi:hypothetical protein
MANLPQSAALANTTCIGCDDLSAITEISGLELDTVPRDDYQTVNEISLEMRALITSWENTWPTDYESSHLVDHSRAVQRTNDSREFEDAMPPPQRYRRVSKNAFKG